MATDPICGMTVDEASALSVERDGKTVYFCSDDCRQKFLSKKAEATHEESAGDDHFDHIKGNKLHEKSQRLPL